MSDSPESLDSLPSFTADLRALYARAKSPTQDTLSRQTGLSRTTISEALNGRRLGSPRTIGLIVEALGEDPSAWIDRHNALSGASGKTASTGAEAAPAEEVSAPSPRRRWPRRVGVAAMVLLVGIVIGGAGGFYGGRAYQIAQTSGTEATEAIDEEQVQITVENGLDPAQTACVNDAEVVASSNRTHDTLLEIIWSNKCRAGWARATRYDGKESGNSIAVTVFPQSNPDSETRASDELMNVQSIYTNVLVRPGDDLICATGSITLGDERISLGDPLCT